MILYEALQYAAVYLHSGISGKRKAAKKLAKELARFTKTDSKIRYQHTEFTVQSVFFDVPGDTLVLYCRVSGVDLPVRVQKTRAGWSMSHMAYVHGDAAIWLRKVLSYNISTLPKHIIALATEVGAIS